MKKARVIIALLIVYFFGFSEILLSQTNNPKHDNNSRQNLMKNEISSENPQLKSKVSTTSTAEINNNVQSQVDTQGKSFELDENDVYQGRKEEFLSQLTVKELPSDFPKYEKWMGVRHYNEVIDNYYKKHLDILIPSVKSKMTQIH